MTKRLLIFMSLFAFFISVQAQSEVSDELMSKKGHVILPQQGDIAIGFNAVPMLDLVFNSMRYISIMGNSAPVANGVANNAITYANANNQITGKYYLSENTAIRARFGLNTLNGAFINPVQDAAIMYQATLGTNDDIDAARLFTVDDKLTYAKSNIMIAAGYEYRRGHNRLQGYYGGEVGFGILSASEKVKYGNDFSDVYEVDYTTNFNALWTNTQDPLDTRVERNLEMSYRSTVNIGIRGFVGIEYFVFPKISIGAEYGFGYALQFLGSQNSKIEVYNNGENGPEVFNEDIALDRTNMNMGLSVDNNNGNFFSLNNTLNGNTALAGGAGAIVLLFHF